MTAAELIDRLKRHPKACERLGITLGTSHGVDYMAVDDTFDTIDTNNEQADADFFRLWLLGACVEWCDEHDIDVVTRYEDDDWRKGLRKMYKNISIPISYESRLHACLAAIEATT